MADKEHESSQSDKFRDMARELEADEDPAHFERVAHHIVDAPIPPKEAKPTHKRGGG